MRIRHSTFPAIAIALPLFWWIGLLWIRNRSEYTYSFHTRNKLGCWFLSAFRRSFLLASTVFLLPISSEVSVSGVHSRGLSFFLGYLRNIIMSSTYIASSRHPRIFSFLQGFPVLLAVRWSPVRWSYNLFQFPFLRPLSEVFPVLIFPTEILFRLSLPNQWGGLLVNTSLHFITPDLQIL